MQTTPDMVSPPRHLNSVCPGHNCYRHVCGAKLSGDQTHVHVDATGRGMCYSIYKVFSRQAVLVASVPRQFLCRVDQQSQQGSQISCSPAVSHCKALGQEDNMLGEHGYCQYA